MPFGDPAFDVTAYISLLHRTHGFFKTWEPIALLNADRIGQVSMLASLVREMPRLDTLERDLAFFGQTPDSNSMPSTYLPPMRADAGLLGSMYVIEGSTLGGQLIAGMLETKLSLSNGEGYSFFVGAGSSTGRRWKAFSGYLAQWSDDHASEGDSVIAAARETFEAYRLWVGTDDRQEKASR